MPQDQFLVLAAVMAGALALAVAAGLWALAEQRTASKLRRALRVSGGRTRAAVGERDALLSAGSEALIVWSRETEAPIAYGAAQAMLDSCLKGPDATALSQALDDLSDQGKGFATTAQDSNGRVLTLRGRAVGGMAAVWLAEEKIAQAHG
ncbi:MAG TPA: hypothetical protein VII39_03065, partial [Bradyrhizobium sp.]